MWHPRHSELCIPKLSPAKSYSQMDQSIRNVVPSLVFTDWVRVGPITPPPESRMSLGGTGINSMQQWHLKNRWVRVGPISPPPELLLGRIGPVSPLPGESPFRFVGVGPMGLLPEAARHVFGIGPISPPPDSRFGFA